MTEDLILKEAYEKLKDDYDIILTSTKDIDDGFTIDTMALAGSQENGKFTVYSDGFLYVFSIVYNDNTSSHFHPDDLEDIVKSIKEFMDEGDINEYRKR